VATLFFSMIGMPTLAYRGIALEF